MIRLFKVYYPLRTLVLLVGEALIALERAKKTGLRNHAGNRAQPWRCRRRVGQRHPDDHDVTARLADDRLRD